MWSIVNSMGHPAHTMGPFTNQKRQFSLNVKEVPIVPGKTFSNPNFVIKEHPSIHNQKSSFIPLPFEKVSHSDISDTNHSHNKNSALINSSQSLVDTLKEYNLDIVKSPKPNSQEKAKSQKKMCSKKRSRRNQRNRRKRMSNKTSKQNEAKSYFNDMVDIETDIETALSCSDVSQSPQIHSNIFNLTDFIVDKPCRLSKMVIDDKDDSDEEEFVATIISVTPSSISIKERQLSVSESEDSFIIFDNGTDEELESSEESDSDSEEDWEDDDEEGEDVVDFVSHPIVPTKKVRFAQDSDLCEIHNMVKWSFAYQQARRGPWEEYARDRDRFKRKAADIEKILAPVFNATHRDNVYRERFRDRSFTE